MAASRLIQSPSARRRGTTADAGNQNDETPRRREIGSSLGYLAAALISVWLLQSAVVPLFPAQRKFPTAN